MACQTYCHRIELEVSGIGRFLIRLSHVRCNWKVILPWQATGVTLASEYSGNSTTKAFKNKMK